MILGAYFAKQITPPRKVSRKYFCNVDMQSRVSLNSLFRNQSPQKKQPGFILLSVMLILAVLATIAFMLNQQVTSGTKTANSQLERNQARYVAEAGLQHGLWHLNAAACGPFTEVGTHRFSEHSYETLIAPNNAGGSVLTYTIAASDDAYIEKDNPTQNFGSDAELQTWFRWFVDEDQRSIIRFDLDSANIANDAQVVSAVARFYVIQGDPARAVTLHQVTAPWVESTVNWNSISADFEFSTTSSIPSSPTAGQYVEVNITSIVQGWINGSVENHGVMLIPSVLSNQNLTRISSKDNGDANTHPELVIKVSEGTLSNRADIISTGTLASGVSKQITRENVVLFQPPTTIDWQPGEELEDTFVWDGAHDDVNFGVSESMDIKDDRNVLVRFAVESLPPGAKVIDAKLSLYAESGNTNTQGIIDVHRITRDWVEGIYDDEEPSPGEGATYETYDGGNDWVTEGGDYDATVIDRVGLNSQGFGWYEWDITTVVQAWLNGEPNYGVLLKESPASTVNVDVSFTTSDSDIEAQRPRLALTLACECGVSCQIPQGQGGVLMVVDDASTPNTQDLFKKTLFEAWGFNVSLIDDGSNQSEFNNQFSTHETVYISESVNAFTLGNRVAAAPIGVVSEEGTLNSDLGIASSDAQLTGVNANIVDNSHYITEQFPAGILPIYSRAMENTYAAGNLAPDLQSLANVSSFPSLAVIESGGVLENGFTASGRRAILPFGRNNNVNWWYINNNGRLMVQRALTWAQGNECTESTRSYRISASENDAEELDDNSIILDGSDLKLTQQSISALLEPPQTIGLRFTNIDIPQASIITAASLEFIADEVDTAPTSLTIFGHNTNHSTAFSNSNNNIDNRPKTSVSVAWDDLPPWTTTGQLHRSPDLSPIVQSIVDRAGWTSGNAMSFIITGTGRRAAVAYDGTAGQAALLKVTACNLPGIPLGPVAHWPFDEISGSVAIDTVGNHVGVLTQAPLWKPGQIQGGLNFNGTDQFVEVTHNNTLSLNQEMTFSAWVKASDVSAGNRTIVSNGTASSSNSNYWFGTIADELAFGFWANGSFNTVRTTNANLQTSLWTHLSASFSNTSNQVVLYIDGVEVASGSINDNPTTASDNVLIGASANDEFWHGTLDEVRIFNRVLDANEVLDLSVRNARGPIAHWTLDETAGVLAADTAGHHDGMLNNGPSWNNGVINGGLEFDGNNDHIVVPHHSYLSLDYAFTISGWINPASLSGTARIISKEQTATNDDYWLSLSGNNLLLGVGGQIHGPVGNFGTNQWYHIAATFDDENDNITISIDGSEVLNETNNNSLSQTIDPLLIGANWQAGNYFEGLLDDIRIYDYALSATEIADIELTGNPDESGGGCSGTFRDEFTERVYDQNHGTLNWSSDWIETGENPATNPAASGDIRITNLSTDNRLRVQDDGQTIRREVDLSGASEARLNFIYTRRGLLESNDYVALDISYNGGSQWQELQRFEGPADDIDFLPYSVQLDSALLSASTFIRFRTPTSGMNNDTNVRFDNVQIECSP